jgi:hypothetical protein
MEPERQRDQGQAGEELQQPATVPVTGEDARDACHLHNVPLQAVCRSDRAE